MQNSSTSSPKEVEKILLVAKQFNLMTKHVACRVSQKNLLLDLLKAMLMYIIQSKHMKFPHLI